MKYVWEAADIIPGRRVTAHNGSEDWLVAYDPMIQSPARWAMVSCRDGMIAFRGRTASEFAQELNNGGNRPIDIRATPATQPDAHPHREQGHDMGGDDGR